VPREEALKRLQASRRDGRDHRQPAAQSAARRLCRHPGDARPEALECVWRRPSPTWPKVAHVQLDSAWVKRLDALLRLGKLVVMLLGVLFAGALVTITFNTIRLQILAQAAEIEVAKLIGATDTYIQRPLHYFGMLQGVLGGLCAALLVSAGLHLLTPPVAELARLYGASFALQGLSARRCRPGGDRRCPRLAGREDLGADSSAPHRLKRSSGTASKPAPAPDSPEQDTSPRRPAR
jgi:cell division transport system permease protein